VKFYLNTITAARLSLSGYRSFYNFDPTTVPSISIIRGVGIYVSEKLCPHEVQFNNSQFQEQLWIEIALKGSDSLLVGCIYRSPSSDLCQSTTALCDLFCRVQGHSHVLICGDFNYPDINWSTLACQLFLDAVNSCCLFQHVTEPTHYRFNTTANTLDLVFTNEDGMINNIEYLPGIGASDHVCLQFNFTCYSSPAPTSRPKYNLNQANFDRMMRELLQNADWNDSLATLDICSAWKLFSDKFTDIINECIPKFVPRRRKKIFLTSRALSLRNKKSKLWCKYKQSNSTRVY